MAGLGTAGRCGRAWRGGVGARRDGDEAEWCAPGMASRFRHTQHGI